MEYAQIAAIAASFATCVTAVIVLLTLLEMKAQRSLSYRPALVPIRQSAHVYKHENQFVWSENRLQEIDALAFVRDYPIHIYNLGRGAAKNIKLKWELDVPSIIDAVNKLCQKNMSQVFIELDKNKWMSINEAGAHRGSINTALDMEGMHDHLLPASIDKEGLSIRLPKTFETLASYYFSEGGKTIAKDDDSSILESRPKITLSIAFEDITGAKHSAKFAFTLNLVMYSATQFTAMLENESAT